MIPLPERSASAVDSLTPREIVAELDKYVVGQGRAKRAVAIALRNRLRRQKLAPEEMCACTSATRPAATSPTKRARLRAASAALASLLPSRCVGR